VIEHHMYLAHQTCKPHPPKNIKHFVLIYSEI